MSRKDRACWLCWEALRRSSGEGSGVGELAGTVFRFLLLAAAIDLVVMLGWGRVGALSGGLLAAETGSSSVLAVVCRFSRFEDAVDIRNCNLPALLNQSCKDIDLFVAASSRNSFNNLSDD